VFSKYPSHLVRSLGKEYMKLYQLLHANEKPVDISNSPPFANTESLNIGDSPDDLIFLRKKGRSEEEIQQKVEERQEKKKQELEEQGRI